jgi:hypothetical protein
VEIAKQKILRDHIKGLRGKYEELSRGQIREVQFT